MHLSEASRKRRSIKINPIFVSFSLSSTRLQFLASMGSRVGHRASFFFFFFFFFHLYPSSNLRYIPLGEERERKEVRTVDARYNDVVGHQLS